MAERKSQDSQTGYKYGTVEECLWGLYGVPARGLGSFRAQMRHLRNIGIPELAEPGSGHKLNYTLLQVTEIGIALSLSYLGLRPSAIAEFAHRAAKQAIGLQPGQECYGKIMQHDGGLTMEFEDRNRGLWLRSIHSAVIVNVARIAREVENALKQKD